MAVKSRRGRPTSYKDEYAEQATKLCRLGATDADLADFFGVSTRTISAWQVRYPEFLQALKAGKQEADERVERSLFQKAVGYEYDAVKIFNSSGEPLIVPYREKCPPDTTAAIFWLKNRRPEQWRDKVINEHTGKDGEPIQVEQTATDEIISRISRLSARAGANGSTRKDH